MDIRYHAGMNRFDSFLNANNLLYCRFVTHLTTQNSFDALLYFLDFFGSLLQGSITCTT